MCQIAKLMLFILYIYIYIYIYVYIVSFCVTVYACVHVLFADTDIFTYFSNISQKFRWKCEMAGFPIRFQLVGDILGQMAKNFMKTTKSTFLGQNSGRHGETSQFFG